MPYEPTGNKNFVNPTDGEHDAVVFGWEDRGISTTTYNRKEREVHQAVLKYEILDETLPDEEQFGDNAGKRLVLWDWINIAWGKRAKLTERRAAILGMDIDDVVNQDIFDENDLLGQRVIIYVKENENGNPKVLDVHRHKDQNYGELENDLEAKGFDEDPAGVNGRAPSKPQTSGGNTQASAPSPSPAKPSPPSRPKPPSSPKAPNANSRSLEEQLSDAKEYFALLIAKCTETELMDNGQEWLNWADGIDANDASAMKELKDNITSFETTLKEAGVALPMTETTPVGDNKEVHPNSTGGDDLPF